MLSATALLCLATFAETAEVRIAYGTSSAKAGRVERRTVELEKSGDASWRFTLPKAEIPK
jgi:hypothetical protein